MPPDPAASYDPDCRKRGCGGRRTAGEAQTPRPGPRGPRGLGPRSARGPGQGAQPRRAGLPPGLPASRATSAACLPPARPQTPSNSPAERTGFDSKPPRPRGPGSQTRKRGGGRRAWASLVKFRATRNLVVGCAGEPVAPPHHPRLPPRRLLQLNSPLGHWPRRALRPLPLRVLAP